MKAFFALIVVILVGLTARSQGTIPACTGPKFIFLSSTHSDRCDGLIEVSASVCPLSVTGPYAVEYVVWTITGPGSPYTETTNSLEISYQAPVSGNYTVSAIVYCTVGGSLCYSPIYAVLNDNCAQVNPPTNLNLGVSVYDISLFVSDPLQPTTIYSNTPVDVSTNQSGSLTSYSYVKYIDGVANPNSTPINSVPPALLINNMLFSPGQHTVELFVEDKGVNCQFAASVLIEVVDSSEIAPCATCFTFQPLANERYWFSAWVKADVASPVKTYSNLSMYAKISYTGNATIATLTPEGEIIDGWQRIAGEFTVPNPTPGEIKVELVNDNTTVTAYFDDVRIHPFNGSMKSYVNDPQTFWLLAELDDNNYATFYEYDKEGKLIRIKKETERGIMTIQENRTSNPKQ